MKTSEQEYNEALSFLRTKLAQAEPEVDRWLNEIVDGWIAGRKMVRRRKQRV